MNKSSFNFGILFLIEMIQHIALTINDSEEIENFYESGNMFEIKEINEH